MKHEAALEVLFRFVGWFVFCLFGGWLSQAMLASQVDRVSQVPWAKIRTARVQMLLFLAFVGALIICTTLYDRSGPTDF